MAIKCGHCHDYHNTIPEVKECSLGRLTPPVLAGVRVADRPSLESREITEGIWYWGPRILKVQKAVHGSGRLYTKELVRDTGLDTWHFEMLSGGLYRLRQEADVRKMTVEEAAEFGKLYGVCCRCGRTLTDEESIALGIGPICKEKF